jgi:DNA repair protein RadD
MIKALGTGELQVLTNCGLISEGLDVPNVSAAILLRPTKSLALHLQQVGRALRPAPGKERALILDHAGNTFRFGPADAPRKWRLTGRAESQGGTAPVQRCGECGALISIAAFVCPECGTVVRERHEHVERRTVALVEIDRLAAMRYRQALRWAGANEARLRLVAQARGYKPGWIFHHLRELREGEA